jgi:hypothetical protein
VTAESPQVRVIHNAVLHIINEQPLLADLVGLPGPGDVLLVCTNVRSMTGKRPVWADNVQSTFYFPWVQLRFLEISPEAMESGPQLLKSGEPEPEMLPADEPELEIDEDFLRRVRDA